ncbi:hypothetical protein F3K50_03395 [Pseudomonas marginalis]|nr:hypothetical protein F3K50_03395 [Pseudomonas marginalis]
MGKLNVVSFAREGWRDPVRTLRKIADELESGEAGACKVGVLAVMSDAGEVKAFGFGPSADDLQTLALFRLGEQKLIDVLLDTESP